MFVTPLSYSEWQCLNILQSTFSSVCPCNCRIDMYAWAMMFSALGFVLHSNVLPEENSVPVSYNNTRDRQVQPTVQEMLKNYLSIYLWCWLEKGHWPITQVFVTSSNMTKLSYQWIIKWFVQILDKLCDK